MPNQAEIIKAYLDSTKPRRFGRAPRDAKAAQVRKSFAKQLARTASRSVKDRHNRAEVNAAVYNHLTPLLEQHHRAQRELQHFYSTLLFWLGGALVGAVAAIAAMLSL